jgi:butyrate kinase
MQILAIHPEVSRTKVGVWDSGILYSNTIPWEEQTAHFLQNEITEWLHTIPIPVQSLQAVAARGGYLKPIQSGVYEINDLMIRDSQQGQYGNHPANLGPIVGSYFMELLAIPGFVVDPVSVNEVWPKAMVTGCPDMIRNSYGHALTIRYVSRMAAEEQQISLETSRFVVAHLSTEINIASVLGGRIVDLNNANDEGPFSLERAGGLPFASLLELCSKIRSQEEMLNIVLKQSGLKGYLGISDLQEIQTRTDEFSKLVYEAMTYQISKEIGAYAAVLKGNLDGIVLTGEMVRFDHLVDQIKKRVGFLGPIMLYPGDQDLCALVNGVIRILNKEETAEIYPKESDNYGFYHTEKRFVI